MEAKGLIFLANFFSWTFYSLVILQTLIPNFEHKKQISILGAIFLSIASSIIAKWFKNDREKEEHNERMKLLNLQQKEQKYKLEVLEKFEKHLKRFEDGNDIEEIG